MTFTALSFWAWRVQVHTAYMAKIRGRHPARQHACCASGPDDVHRVGPSLKVGDGLPSLRLGGQLCHTVIDSEQVGLQLQQVVVHRAAGLHQRESGVQRIPDHLQVDESLKLPGHTASCHGTVCKRQSAHTQPLLSLWVRREANSMAQWLEEQLRQSRGTCSLTPDWPAMSASASSASTLCSMRAKADSLVSEDERSPPTRLEISSFSIFVACSACNTRCQVPCQQPLLTRCAQPRLACQKSGALIFHAEAGCSLQALAMCH